MRAQNRVIAGDYEKSEVHIKGGKPFLSTGFSKRLFINGTTVKTYEVLNDEHQKSLSSGVARGILFGAVGVVAGGVSGKTKGVYQIAVEFKNGKKSLLEVDETIHSAIGGDFTFRWNFNFCCGAGYDRQVRIARMSIFDIFKKNKHFDRVTLCGGCGLKITS